MVKVEGINEVKSAIEAIRDSIIEGTGGPDEAAAVQVGFTQRYAIHVHENINTFHPVGQAKFLETPARALAATFGSIITKIFKRTGSLEKALIVAGLRLQREAQKLTPVDTSALRASAYTAFERDADAASSAAFAKSEGIRKKGRRS